MSAIYRKYPWFAVGMAVCALSQAPVVTMPPDQAPEQKMHNPLPPRSRKFVRMSKKGRKK
jgi:hypothetical protein